MFEFFDQQRLEKILPATTAVKALEDVLLHGLDPEESTPRLFVDRPNGQFLIMPANSGGFHGQAMSGVKVLTLTKTNSANNLPPIQGVYLLFEEATGAPVAMFDGAALTAIRTPATTVLAIMQLLKAQRSQPPQRSLHVVVYGTGVQAEGHIRVLSALLPNASFTLCGRSFNKMNDLEQRLVAERLNVRANATPDLYQADIVILATSSSTPVIKDADIHENLIIAAIGQHGLDAREVEPATVERSTVLLEGKASALAENGNVTCLHHNGMWKNPELCSLAESIRNERTIPDQGPWVYTGVGMAWEDLAIAMVTYEMACQHKGMSRHRPRDQST